MFKQKLIPLAGAMLMLVGCGCGNSAIEVNEVVSIEGQETALISKKINVKKGSIYNFHINYGSFTSETIFEASPSNIFCFANGEMETLEVYDLIDENSIKITYNEQELTKYPGTYEEWSSEQAGGDNTKYKYAYGKETEIAMDDAMVLSFDIDATVGKKPTDDIKISFKVKDSKDGIYAQFIPFGTH